MIMARENKKSFSWNFYSKVIILAYCALQVLRWRLFPQFMDTYYHLLAAWGFIQAGGYSGWDFWQYAPVGRVHIYPPVFHIILALLIKLGINKIILVKFFETAAPVIFLIVLWRFLRKNYSEIFAFFVVLVFGSSISFYLSLINHIPATLAFIFGFLSLGQLFRNKILRAAVLLGLCFYTHIGVSWFFALSLIFFALFNSEYRKGSFIVLIFSLLLSLPIIFKQVFGFRFVSALGINLHERYICQVKVVDYLLAFFGSIFVFRKDKKYRLFLSFLPASLIFLVYPYRLLSAEGYLPIIFLCALALLVLYENYKDKKIYLKSVSLFLPVIFILLFSPTLSMDRPEKEDSLTYKMHFFDSAFLGMFLARGQTMWLPEYVPTARAIQDNSADDDIIYSSLNSAGMALAGISGRATVNALFPEIRPAGEVNAFLHAKIIVFTRLDDLKEIDRIADYYKLERFAENKMFILYKNGNSHTKVSAVKSPFPFALVLVMALVFSLLYWQGGIVKKG